MFTVLIKLAVLYQKLHNVYLADIYAFTVLHLGFICLSSAYEYCIIGAIIRLGSSHLFRFNNPGEAARLRQEMKDVSK